MMNTICNVYPELWEAHLKRGVKRKGPINLISHANSILQNQAVVDITKRLIEYLNAKSLKLKDKKANEKKITLKSIHGDFIYDLLTDLGIYMPRKTKEKAEKGSKVAYYHALAKLVARSEGS